MAIIKSLTFLQRKYFFVQRIESSTELWTVSSLKRSASKSKAQTNCGSGGGGGGAAAQFAAGIPPQVSLVLAGWSAVSPQPQPCACASPKLASSEGTKRSELSRGWNFVSSSRNLIRQPQSSDKIWCWPWDGRLSCPFWELSETTPGVSPCSFSAIHCFANSPQSTETQEDGFCTKVKQSAGKFSSHCRTLYFLLIFVFCYHHWLTFARLVPELALPACCCPLCWVCIHCSYNLKYMVSIWQKHFRFQYKVNFHLNGKCSAVGLLPTTYNW